MADYAGKKLYVEFFATWCPTCRGQLQRVSEAANTDPNAVFLALSVETNVQVADLAKYQKDSSFERIEFGLMSPEMLAAVAADLGHSAVNPPATPHLLLDSSGAAGAMTTGSIDAADILAALASVG